MNKSIARMMLALVLSLSLAAPAIPQSGMAQVRDFSKGTTHWPHLWGPYVAAQVPAPNLQNSPRVDQLIRDGKLYLGLEDAIALALENNLEIAVSRYNPQLADTDLLRTKAGGIARGVGGLGTATALGVTTTASFDPIVTSQLNWGRRTTPLNNVITTGVPKLINGVPAVIGYQAQANFSYTQAFQTGSAFSISYNNTRNSTISRFTLFNPSVSSTLQFAFTQKLLSGFGYAANARFIRIAKNNRHITDLQFAADVIRIVSDVQSQYWDLVFVRDDVKVRERSLALAQKLYDDNKRQVEIGTLAPIEIVRAEAEVARTRQDLIVSTTALQQQQIRLKNALTKNPMDQQLALIEIEPTDQIIVPPVPEVIPIQDAVKLAWEKRPDVQQARLDLKNRDLTIRAVKNTMLPTVDLFASYAGAGLSGNTVLRDANGNAILDAAGQPILTENGVQRAFTQGIQGQFPEYAFGLNITIPIKNRAGQADAARAMIEARQAETKLKSLENTVVVDVRNAQIALEQNRARIDAARKARELAERTLDAEQKKYQLGASTIFLVIQAQRDLSAAQSVEVRALADFKKAEVEFDRALGRTLERHSIQLSAALSGVIEREPNIPGTTATLKMEQK